MNTRGRVAVFQGVLTVVAEQPCGVQVVEWVGYFPSAFNSAPVLLCNLIRAENSGVT